MSKPHSLENLRSLLFSAVQQAETLTNRLPPGRQNSVKTDWWNGWFAAVILNPQAPV